MLVWVSVSVRLYMGIYVLCMHIWMYRDVCTSPLSHANSMDCLECFRPSVPVGYIS